MKRNKILLIAVMVISMLFVAMIPVVSNATVATQPLYLGITELRTNDSPNMGYAIGTPKSNQESGDSAKIWNILEYTGPSSSDPVKANGSKNIYCLKAGVGFTDTNAHEIYNVFYDMKTERDEIASFDDLKSIVEGTVPDNAGTGTVDKYDALLALCDLLYLIDDTNDEAEKEAYLEAAGIHAEEWDFSLTRDDIAAVQQAAMWYFTNYYKDDGNGGLVHDMKYDKTASNATGWLNYTLNGSDYTSLSQYELGTQEGVQRQQQAEILYRYLIKTAKDNANNYSGGENLGSPVTINTNTLNYEENGNNYLFGPIDLEKQNSIPYTIDFIVSNGGTPTESYQLYDSQKQPADAGKTVKDFIEAGEEFYIALPKDQVTTVSIDISIKYNDMKLTLWAHNTYDKEQPVMIPEKKEESEDKTLTVTPNQEIFDLALRKYITKINDTELTTANTRVPNIDENTLQTGTTATYKHRKDPVMIKSGDEVTYKITIYNEGEKDGRATKVVDQLPTGLEFVEVVSGNFELGSYDEENNTVNLVRKANNTDNLPAYEEGNLSSETIEIKCRVTATADTTKSKILTNVAWISEEFDAESNITITDQVGADRDSEPATTPDVNKDNMENYTGNGNKTELNDSDYYYKGQQDDDDFEKLVLLPESFDLKLIKRITAVNNQAVPERIENVDVSKLNTLDGNGNLITTGEYTLNKEPVGVKKGDIVTYTFRIYNEGTIDGYASEITEDIPEGLEFLWSEKENEDLANDETLTEEEKEAIEFNQSYLWKNFVYDESGERIIQISTDYLSKEYETTESNLIPAFGSNDGTKTEEDISYKEVSVKLKVISDDVTGSIIRNEACISEDTDGEGNEVDDRDSDTEEWVKYEDDEDYDNIILQSFDLALRKFIVAVSDDETIENEEYLRNADGSYTRAPVVDTSLLNTVDENGNMITTAIYNHTKEPVLVQPNDMVVYMLRVYNEGEIDGYAAEIKDHLPPYLEYVDNEFNQEYGWEVSEDGRTVTTRYLENSLVEKAQKDDNGTYVLSYVEVPIMCKVSENAKTSENITNIADITEYQDENKEPVTDRDSQEDNVELPSDEELPGYKDEETGSYVPGQQDDDDFEKVIIKIFDLSLRKWVTQAIVIDENGQTITETGHQPYDDPEKIVKVEIHRNSIDDVTVKFRYSIRVTNEGEIAGYAKEITDYVPEGLRFLPEDNPGWTDEGNNVISTRLLENTLLQPGEYAEVEVVLTWINDENNMGVMVNTAEISEDYNDYDVPDIDSTPDNQVEGEDDIDDAPVMLSVSTGQARIYFTLGFVILVTIAGGVVLIKKFVL